MDGDPVLPIWLVLPLAVVTMVLLGLHLVSLRAGRAIAPPSRYRIRSVNGGMMLALVPMLAVAFGVVPPAERKLFVLVWAVSAALLGMVIVLASLDGVNNMRLGRREAADLRDEQLKEMALLRAEAERVKAEMRREAEGDADG